MLTNEHACSYATSYAQHKCSCRQGEHEELKKLARDLGTTVGEAVAIAARRLRQQRIVNSLTQQDRQAVAYVIFQVEEALLARDPTD